VACALHDLDHPGHVYLGREQLEQVVEQHGLFFEVEDNCAVPKVVVGDLDDVLAEQVVSPGGGRVLHHSDDSLVLLIVVAV